MKNKKNCNNDPNPNAFTRERENNSVCKIKRKGETIYFFKRKIDARAYLREKRADWFKDFRDGFWGDCALPFNKNCTYVENSYIERGGGSDKIEIIDL